jgi:Fe(3+) dicitrate transport protein
MRTEAGQGSILPSQATDVHLVVNLSGEYRLKKLGSDRHMASLYVSLRNLFDRESIVARRPAGARPGLPRTIMGGLRFSFGR